MHSINPNVAILYDINGGNTTPSDYTMIEAVNFAFNAGPTRPYGVIWDYVQNWFWAPSSPIQSAATSSTRLAYANTHGWLYMQNMSPNRAGVIPSDQVTAFTAITHN